MILTPFLDSAPSQNAGPSGGQSSRASQPGMFDFDLLSKLF